MTPCPRPRLASVPASLLCLLIAATWAASARAGHVVLPYPQPDPSGAEQYLLELVNRARANPAAEGTRLAATTDRDILANYAHFKVSAPTLAADFARYPAQPPLAMNARLMASARAHSLDLAKAGAQRHDGTDGSTFDGRITATGYDWSSVGENVYAWALGPLFAHMGFNADWGVPAHDHRVNLMGLATDATTFREVGVSLVSTRLPDFGPFVVTQDFATPADPTAAYALGVVYADANANGTYDPGEGLSDVTISPDTGGWYAVTASAGGFVLPLPRRGSGLLTITASGGTLGAPRTRQVAWTAGTNVKVDFTTADAKDPVLADRTTAAPAG